MKKHWIGGEWVGSAGGGVRKIENPSTLEIVVDVPLAMPIVTGIMMMSPSCTAAHGVTVIEFAEEFELPGVVQRSRAEAPVVVPTVIVDVGPVPMLFVAETRK